MRRLMLATIAPAVSAAAAQALVLDPAGDWRCTVGDMRIELTLEGETYRWADETGRMRAGDLALQPDGLTYTVEMGTLRDRVGVRVIAFDYNDGDERLVLGGRGATPRPVGECTRL